MVTGCAVDGAPLHATRQPPGRHRIPVRPALQKFISARGWSSAPMSSRRWSSAPMSSRPPDEHLLSSSCCAKCTAPGDSTVYGAPLLGLHGISSIVTKYPPSP